MTNPPDKPTLRRLMRARRHRLSNAERRHAAIALTRRLRTQHFFVRSRRLACYIANDGEIDPMWIAITAQKWGKEIYLPVLRPGKTLWFVRYRQGDPLIRNRFNIPEPNWRRQRRIACWALDAVLMPLVAFDGDGNRLGMGGGYYDRSLAASLRGQRRKPALLGLAYHWQEVAALPVEPWDIPLTAIATDRGYHRFAS